MSKSTKRATPTRRDAPDRQRRKSTLARSRPNARSRNKIAVLDRAASLLFALSHSTQPTTLNEAAKLSGLSKATAFRILSTLTEEGFVAQDEANSSYRLGVMPLRLATSVLDSIPIQPIAKQAMRTVCETLNETTVLSIVEGDTRVSIDAVECTNAIGSNRRIGEPRPMHIGAAGRVLMAGLPDDEIESYFKRLSKIPGAPRIDKVKMWQQLRRIRRTGFASSTAEVSPDIHAVAIAVKSPDGRTIAALHVSIPTGRFSPRVEAKCRQALSRAAREITRDMRAA